MRINPTTRNSGGTTVKKVLFAVLTGALVLAMAGTAFAAAEYIFVSGDLGGNREFKPTVMRTVKISATNNTGALVNGRFKMTVKGLTGAPLAGDVAVNYESAPGSGIWLPLTFTVNADDELEGFFGPAGGFPMADGYSATTAFQVTFAAATEGRYNLKLQVVDATDVVIAAAGENNFELYCVGATYNGTSFWTYKDLHDATAKYEGGYAAYNGVVTGTYATTSSAYGDTSGTSTRTSGPHGGYNTNTNKCKVCHAVHRAEGAYYLLRADSQDDACSYCHVGSAHSTKVVYDLNPDGIYTTNGHTIGAQTQIPDSSIMQVAEDVTLSTTDANGDPISENIKVRSYESAKNSMYRFARHHGQSAPVSWVTTPGVTPMSTDGLYVTGSARSGYIKVGPLALRCMNCHQPHNAVNEVWRPRAFTAWDSTNYTTAVDGSFLSAGYKLLRRYPSASTVGIGSTTATDSTGAAVDEFWSPTQVVKAIEDTASAGRNFSQNRSGDFTYTENGVTRVAPLWIAQDIHAPDPIAYPVNGTGVYRYPNTVNNMTLSYWCADCHNLNIGGWEPLADQELGFKAHNEKTHPAPFYGAYSGPGQCYSCHRNDLAPKMGLTAVQNPVPDSTGASHAVPNDPYGSSRNSCTQCHYGTNDYNRERNVAITYARSDFPHSGAASDIKMLGSYSVTADGSSQGTITAATVTSNNIDAVCVRCHPGIGFNH
jgi:hypothetical protein